MQLQRLYTYRYLNFKGFFMKLIIKKVRAIQKSATFWPFLKVFAGFCRKIWQLVLIFTVSSIKHSYTSHVSSLGTTDVSTHSYTLMVVFKKCIQGFAHYFPCYSNRKYEQNNNRFKSICQIFLQNPPRTCQKVAEFRIALTFLIINFIKNPLKLRYL